MDERRNSTFYATRQQSESAKAARAMYEQNRQPSYRRPAQVSAPVYNYEEDQREGHNVAPNMPRGFQPAPAQNGASRSKSQRRYESQQYPPQGGQLPTQRAPSQPGPPIEAVPYEDPYGTSYPPNPNFQPSRTKSDAARKRQSQPHPTVQIPPTKQYNGGQGMTSPLSPMSGDAYDRDGRQGSVSHKSPLQNLERAVDKISKQEKRARIEEAEMAAQDRAMGRASSRRDRDTTGLPRDARRSIDAGQTAALPRNDGTRRQANVLPPNSAPVQDRDRAVEGTMQPPRSAYTQRPDDSNRIRSTRNQGADLGRSAQHGGGSVREVDHHHRARNDGAGAAAAATGLGLSGMGHHQRDHRQTEAQHMPGASRERGVSNSRGGGRNRDPNAMPQAQHQLQTDRTGHPNGAAIAQQHQDPDPLPPEAVRTKQPGPKYEIPPQTAAGQRARDEVGFSSQDPEKMAEGITNSAHPHHHHLSDMLHRHHDTERRYQAPKLLDEWKRGGTAALVESDLDLDNRRRSTGAPGPETNKAWWEKGGSNRRASASARQDSTTGHGQYDGAYEDSTRPTSFQPKLFLKNGPLLRYVGTRRKSARQEIWRGSVMIVTEDHKSVYRPAPVLRLFAQPMDLMPPPPPRIDPEDGMRLAPEYVDPLAGQSKVSRVGKTLYVRPVEDLEEETDLSRIEDDRGLFSENPAEGYDGPARIPKAHGERLGKYREVQGVRLHSERGVTFWRFNIQAELGTQQRRVAYRINKGPAIGFWIPARGETMNIMFHSCNGFSMSVDSNKFCGPDPMWRDVLNNHQTQPFHVMIGGGDQIYNDAAMRQTKLFAEWTAMKNPHHKHSTPFSAEMQDELEQFYLDRYSMWFSQGLFGMAASQIPMVNMWDDHDIIDGFGSYPHHFMQTNVFCGLGAVAYKYYMLFQHQSVADETAQYEPSWILGSSPGPYINELSRSLFMFMGRHVAFLALDCRTERMNDSILSEETYDLCFERCRKEIVKGETRHLIVLLGVPIAYPRLNFLENVLTSRAMDPIKALGRTGMLGGFVNKFDGGVEILDDLDDHWTAKHHKDERNWFIQELQELAAEKSVRITILGGDVHLAAVGQFYTKKKLSVPKDQDHRYMPNVVSSAIVNAPPPDLMADVLNRRNKIHHLDNETDEDMIPLFTHDVNGKARNNKRLLPHRNWCSIKEYLPGTTPPPTPPPQEDYDGADDDMEPPPMRRTLSLGRGDFAGGLIRRFSGRGQQHPPVALNRYNVDGAPDGRRNSSDVPHRRASSTDSLTNSQHQRPRSATNESFKLDDPVRPNPFHRRPTGLSEKAARLDMNREGHINLEGGLDIVLNVEVSQKDPAGITTPYRLLVPALNYTGKIDQNHLHRKGGGFMSGLGRRFSTRRREASQESIGQPYDEYGDTQDGAFDEPPPEHSQRQDTHSRKGFMAGLGRRFSSGQRRLSEDDVGEPHDAYDDTDGGARCTPPLQHDSRQDIPARRGLMAGLGRRFSSGQRRMSEDDMGQSHDAYDDTHTGGRHAAPPQHDSQQTLPARRGFMAGLGRRFSSRRRDMSEEDIGRPYDEYDQTHDGALDTPPPEHVQRQDMHSRKAHMQNQYRPSQETHHREAAVDNPRGSAPNIARSKTVSGAPAGKVPRTYAGDMAAQARAARDEQANAPRRSSMQAPRANQPYDDYAVDDHAQSRNSNIPSAAAKRLGIVGAPPPIGAHSLPQPQHNQPGHVNNTGPVTHQRQHNPLPSADVTRSRSNKLQKQRDPYQMPQFHERGRLADQEFADDRSMDGTPPHSFGPNVQDGKYQGPYSAYDDPPPPPPNQRRASWKIWR